ncbi:Conserved oligomeric Golgi complex subunit 6 [Camellia lanceoleosa]|uniref:Conserved oligomeric Golgi complex subunit 6 n=1 Tax=Camellia lanceoleosa TaxID=1840588 RepID=A0ACC0HWJ9_9ERIC|nr:Conserved oligomeric Golgi complex subunit 6 [Camellia lanceoleosa]
MGTVTTLAPGVSRKMKKALDRVEEEVNALAKCCDKIAKALNSCNATTGDIIYTTERINRNLKLLHKDRMEEDMNDNFFKALSHVQEIHANCKVLLRTHHQHTGLELMDMMAVYQEGAYERLCRRFIPALTRGGPGGLPRPIEVHAHDPLHYAFASERELVLVLLDPDVVVDTGPTAHRFSKGLESDLGKIETDFSFALDRIFEGVCQPFKVRVKQVLQSQPNIMISYKLSNTLEFYSQPYLREGVLMLLEIIEIKHNSMMITASGKNPIFDPVISALIDCIIQMCEQAAEAHMSKGAIHSSRRSRTSSDLNKSSVNAIFKNSSSLATSQPSETPSKIFLINCLCAIRQPLFGREVASKYIMEKEVDAILRC